MATSGPTASVPKTSATARSAVTSRSRPTRVGVAVLFGGLGVTGALAVTGNPGLALAALLGVAGLAVAVTNLGVAVGILIASFFFEGYLSSGATFLTPAKAIGMLAIGAWVVDWGVGRAKTIAAPQLWWICGLALWIVAAMTVSRDDTRAVV